MNAALPDQPANAAHCWLASLILILAHCPKIVFGVLEVILRHDPVPGQSFGGQKRLLAWRPKSLLAWLAIGGEVNATGAAKSGAADINYFEDNPRPLRSA